MLVITVVSEVGAPAATVGQGWRVELGLAAGTSAQGRRRRPSWQGVAADAEIGHARAAKRWRPGWWRLAAAHTGEHLVRSSSFNISSTAPGTTRLTARRSTVFHSGGLFRWLAAAMSSLSLR